MSLRGDPKFASLRAQASAAATDGEATVVWRGTGKKLKPKSEKAKKTENAAAGGGDADADADAKKPDPADSTSYQFQPSKGDQKTVFSLDSRKRVKVLVQALESPETKATDVEGGPAGEFGDLGMFEFTLTDTIEAWTAAKAESNGGGGDESPKKDETTIKLEGLFVSTEYETIGKAGAVLQLEGSE